jgi:phospholipid-binding lipoprotein MlaA
MGPLAKTITAIVAALLLSALSVPTSAVAQNTEADQATRTLDAKPNVTQISDPIEGFNRVMYVFNTRFDRYVFLPTVRSYEWIMPNVAEQGVTNFFGNIGEAKTLFNSTLQLKPRVAGITLSRFIVNSTLGIGGLMDPATPLGLPQHKEDFGQTLGRYGVGNGPYLVLPIFGPSNLRDTSGTVVDFAAQQALFSAISFDSDTDMKIRAGLGLLDAIDTRKNIAFRYHETGTPFEYELVRYLYTKMREVQISR